MKIARNINIKAFSFLTFVFLAVFVFAGCSKLPFVKSPGGNTDIKVSADLQGGQVAVLDSNIIVNSPLSNDKISSPVEISGRASVFEGTVLFRLKDSFNRVLGRGFTISSSG